MSDYKNLRDTLAAGPTEGPWKWRINRNYKQISLVGRNSDIVMDFARWGMGGASPRFACHKTPLKILDRPVDRPDWIADSPDHTTAHRKIVQVDAAFMEAADPTTIRALLADLDELRAALAKLTAPRPVSEWSEDFGAVLWWKLPVGEAPYCGEPTWDDWPWDEESGPDAWTPLPEIKA